jgi:hypothetical protein
MTPRRVMLHSPDIYQPSPIRSYPYPSQSDTTTAQGAIPAFPRDDLVRVLLICPDECIFAYGLDTPKAAQFPAFSHSNSVYDGLNMAGVATRGTILGSNNHIYNDWVCVLRVL